MLNNLYKIASDSGTLRLELDHPNPVYPERLAVLLEPVGEQKRMLCLLGETSFLFLLIVLDWD